MLFNEKGTFLIKAGEMWHGPRAAGGSGAIVIQDGPPRTGHAAALTGPYRWKALENAANETQADIRPAARSF